MFDPRTAVSWLKGDDGAPLGRFLVLGSSAGGPRAGRRVELAVPLEPVLLVVGESGVVLGRLPLVRLEVVGGAAALDLLVEGRLALRVLADVSMPRDVVEGLPSVLGARRESEVRRLSEELGLGGGVRHACQGCGGLARDVVATSDALDEVLAAIGLDRPTWLRLRDQDPEEPILPARLEGPGFTHEAAAAALEKGERLKVFERSGRGHRVAFVRCADCYRRALASR